MIRIFGLNAAQFGGQTIQDYFKGLGKRSNNQNQFGLIRKGLICPDDTKIYFTHKTEIIASFSCFESRKGDKYLRVIPGSIRLIGNIYVSDLIEADVKVLFKNNMNIERTIVVGDPRVRAYIKPQDEIVIQQVIAGNKPWLILRSKSLSNQAMAILDNRKPEEVSVNTNRFKIENSISKTVLERANYQCLVDPSHTTFTSNSGPIYMEAHHLIPMSKQMYFKENLDRSQNIACICPNCHRAIHHGTTSEKQSRITVLYQKLDRAGLSQAIVGIDLSKIISFYI